MLIPHFRVEKGLDLYLHTLCMSARVSHELTFSRLKFITSLLYSVCNVFQCYLSDGQLPCFGFAY
jgi:hypothetical protein